MTTILIVGATILDIEVHGNVMYAARRVASAYWNPKTETLGREQLDALQLAKLRRQVAWAAERSPWFKRSLAGIDLDRLRSLQDMRGLPMLTRDEWMNSQFEHPPYGEIPAIDGEGAIRIHTTSGTTGRGPLRAIDSRKD